MILLQDVPDGEEVAEGFRHLLAVDPDKAVMDPVPGQGLAGRPLRLGDLVLVVGKDQVLSAPVDVEGVPQVALAHHGTLQMPAGSAVPPGALPPGFPFLARLPEGKIEGIAFLVVHVDAGAGQHVVEVPAGELAVPGELFHRIVDIAIHRIGQPLFDQRGHQADHPVDMLRRPGGHRRPGDAERLHVLIVLPDVPLGDLGNPFLLPAAPSR